MDTYRQGGEARVYWLGVPLPRDGRRQRGAAHGERRLRGGGAAVALAWCASST